MEDFGPEKGEAVAKAGGKVRAKSGGRSRSQGIQGGRGRAKPGAAGGFCRGRGDTDEAIYSAAQESEFDRFLQM